MCGEVLHQKTAQRICFPVSKNTSGNVRSKYGANMFYFGLSSPYEFLIQKMRGCLPVWFHVTKASGIPLFLLKDHSPTSSMEHTKQGNPEEAFLRTLGIDRLLPHALLRRSKHSRSFKGKLFHSPLQNWSKAGIFNQKRPSLTLQFMHQLVDLEDVK